MEPTPEPTPKPGIKADGNLYLAASDGSLVPWLTYKDALLRSNYYPDMEG